MLPPYTEKTYFIWCNSVCVSSPGGAAGQYNGWGVGHPDS